MMAQTPPLGFAIHQLKPGDKVLIKTRKEENLSPLWEGPFLVLLTTETAVRTAEKGWTHVLRVKGPVKEWKITSEPGETKLTIRRTSRGLHQRA